MIYCVMDTEVAVTYRFSDHTEGGSNYLIY